MNVPPELHAAALLEADGDITKNFIAAEKYDSFVAGAMWRDGHKGDK